jgi:arylsulfatase
MDYHVGEILDAVDSLGIRNNTIFVFTSDNGPDPTAPSQGSSGPWSGLLFYAHGRLVKNTFYNPVAR